MVVSSRPVVVTKNSDFVPVLRGMIVIYSQMHRTDELLTKQLNHLASLAKWLSVRLQTKFSLVGVPLHSLIIFRFGVSFEQGVTSYSGNYRV